MESKAISFLTRVKNVFPMIMYLIRSEISIINLINYNDNTFTSEIRYMESLVNRSITQRFPVSLFAYIYHDNIKNFAYIRNLSLNGLSLCTKQVFEKGRILKINTSIEDKAISIDAKVLWSKESTHGFEYGFEYTNVKEDFLKGIEHCILLLKNDHESAIGQLKYEFESLKRVLTRKINMN